MHFQRLTLSVRVRMENFYRTYGEWRVLISFGYPACPDLEASRELFDILKPEEFGIELSETFQIHPEHSTALMVHHGKAGYYAI